MVGPARHMAPFRGGGLCPRRRGLSVYELAPLHALLLVLRHVVGGPRGGQGALLPGLRQGLLRPPAPGDHRRRGTGRMAPFGAQLTYA